MSLFSLDHEAFFPVFYQIEIVAARGYCIKLLSDCKQRYEEKPQYVVFNVRFIPAVFFAAAAQNRLVEIHLFAFNAYIEQKHSTIFFYIFNILYYVILHLLLF